MARSNQKLINLHGTGLVPDSVSGNMTLGEIAIVTAPNNTMLATFAGTAQKAKADLHYFVDSAATIAIISGIQTDASGKADIVVPATEGNFALSKGDGNIKDAGSSKTTFVLKEAGKELMPDAQGTKLADVAAEANKVVAGDNGKINVTNADANGSETTTTITVYTQPADVAHDANYKPITITEDSVFVDGTKVFTEERNASGIALEADGVTGTTVQAGLAEINSKLTATTITVKEGEKVVDLTNNKLSSQLGLDHNDDYSEIYLTGLNGETICTVNTSAYIVDKYVTSVDWNGNTNILVFTYEDGTTIEVDFGKLASSLTFETETAKYMNFGAATEAGVPINANDSTATNHLVTGKEAYSEFSKMVIKSQDLIAGLAINDGITSNDLTDALPVVSLDTNTSGLMSADDHKKLGTVEEGAQVNVLEDILLGEVTDAESVDADTKIKLSKITNKQVYIDFSELVLDGGEW